MEIKTYRELNSTRTRISTVGYFSFVQNQCCE